MFNCHWLHQSWHFSLKAVIALLNFLFIHSVLKKSWNTFTPISQLRIHRKNKRKFLSIQHLWDFRNEEVANMHFHCGLAIGSPCFKKIWSSLLSIWEDIKNWVQTIIILLVKYSNYFLVSFKPIVIIIIIIITAIIIINAFFFFF